MPKVDVIRANAARYPISAQCRIPDVPRSTYYWMTGHDERVHAQTIQTARYSRAWFRLLVSNRGSFVLTNEEIVRGTRAMPFTSKTETQSAQEFGHYRYRRITVDRHAGFH